MDDLPRQKLKLIIAKYGVVLHDAPQRCEALLRDFCGQYRQEISLLINAQKEKIPAELLNSQNSSLPVSLTIARMSKRLEDNLAIKPEAAKWSVESWALALNLITEAEPLIDEGKSDIRVNPNYARPHIDLGNILKNQGRLEEAKVEYQQAIRLAPENIEAHFYLGQILSDQDKPEEAITEYKKVIRLNPDNLKKANIYYNLGLILQKQGKSREAKTEYQQAIHFNPNLAYPHDGLGLILKNQGKLEEAKAEYQQAIRLDPNYAVAHVNLGNVLYAQGKLEEAKAEYQQAIRLDPNYALTHNNLGLLLEKQGKLEEAKAEYQQAIRLDPSCRDSHFDLRRILENQAKLQEVKSEYPQVENIDIARTTFDKVWYLPEENRWRDMNMLAMRDTGTLVVKDKSLEFQGKKEHVHITDVKKISYGKQGRDFINDWVKINYSDGKTAFFADGSQLGWGGMFGGTRRILDAVRHLEQSS